MLTQKKSGESLIEVIMAIFVIGVGSTVATTLIVTALQANVFSRDSLQAVNLASEGIEAVRSIRDSNWIKFSSNKEICWNSSPDPLKPCKADNNTGLNTNPISAGNYSVDLDSQAATWTWGLSDLGNALDLDLGEAPNANYQLYLIYPSGSSVTDDPIYVSNHIADFSSSKTPTKFFRMVQISYDTGPTDQEMKVVSTVQWKTGGVKHEIVLQTYLTNYQKIKKT